jgi:HAD superfamily phosphoserine phosphatase-like hydrolase
MAIRLAAFDLDGTLIRDMTCVEAIARRIGRADEAAGFERLSMRDVDAVRAAREEMAGWFQGHPEDDLVAALSGLALAPGTERAFERLRSQGVTTAIASITWNLAVESFARRLGADHALGTHHVAGAIEHVWPADKGRWLRDLSARLDLRRSEVAAVGDSENDREMLEAAGLRFFVGQTVPDVPDVVHIPDADMDELACRIVAVR